MAGGFNDFFGTISSYFKLGFGGVRATSENSGAALAARLNDDSAYAAIRAALVQVFGNDIELNSGAAGSGTDWKMTLRRGSTSQAQDIVIVVPGANPTVGQALTVATFSGGVATLQWTTIAAGAEKVVSDTTSLAFGSGATVAMYSAPTNAVHDKFAIIIDTAFDGTPTASVGTSGSPSKYVPSTAIDLKQPAGTVIEIHPGLGPQAAENLQTAYSAGGATVGAARVIGYYSNPA